jgi:hypothetical protein
MQYIIVQSHNGKYGRVEAGSIVAYTDEKYSAQLIRMGLIRPATQADIQANQPRTVYRTKPGGTTRGKK